MIPFEDWPRDAVAYVFALGSADLASFLADRAWSDPYSPSQIVPDAEHRWVVIFVREESVSTRARSAAEGPWPEGVNPNPVQP